MSRRLSRLVYTSIGISSFSLVSALELKRAVTPPTTANDHVKSKDQKPEHTKAETFSDCTGKGESCVLEQGTEEAVAAAFEVEGKDGVKVGVENAGESPARDKHGRSKTVQKTGETPVKHDIANTASEPKQKTNQLQPFDTELRSLLKPTLEETTKTNINSKNSNKEEKPDLNPDYYFRKLYTRSDRSDLGPFPFIAIDLNLFQQEFLIQMKTKRHPKHALQQQDGDRNDTDIDEIDHRSKKDGNKNHGNRNHGSKIESLMYSRESNAIVDGMITEGLLRNSSEEGLKEEVVWKNDGDAVISRIGPLSDSVQPKKIVVWDPKSVEEVRERVVSGELEGGGGNIVGKGSSGLDSVVVRPEQLPLATGLDLDSKLGNILHWGIGNDGSEIQNSDEASLQLNNPPLFLVSLEKTHQSVYTPSSMTKNHDNSENDNLPSWERSSSKQILEKKYGALKQLPYRKFWLLCHRDALHMRLRENMGEKADREGDLYGIGIGQSQFLKLSNADVVEAVIESAMRASGFLYDLTRRGNRGEFEGVAGREAFTKIVRDAEGRSPFAHFEHTMRILGATLLLFGLIMILAIVITFGPEFLRSQFQNREFQNREVEDLSSTTPARTVRIDTRTSTARTSTSASVRAHQHPLSKSKSPRTTRENLSSTPSTPNRNLSSGVSTPASFETKKAVLSKLIGKVSGGISGGIGKIGKVSGGLFGSSKSSISSTATSSDETISRKAGEQQIVTGGVLQSDSGSDRSEDSSSLSSFHEGFRENEAVDGLDGLDGLDGMSSGRNSKDSVGSEDSVGSAPGGQYTLDNMFRYFPGED